MCVCKANERRIWTEKRNQRLLLENLLKYTMLNRFEPWNRRIVFKMRMVANVAAAPVNVNGRMLTFYSAEICIESRIKHWYTYAYLLVIFVYTSKTKYENVSLFKIAGKGTLGICVDTGIGKKLLIQNPVSIVKEGACRCSITLRAKPRVEIYNFPFLPCSFIVKSCFPKTINALRLYEHKMCACL